jgi:FlaG/FlaF family flagellin (archaellin)
MKGKLIMSAPGLFTVFKIVGIILWIAIAITLAAFIYELWNDFYD